MIELRPYQVTAIARVREAIRAGKRRPLLCCPTGGGKTLTAGAVILSAVAKGSRVLFVAHRKELIDQSVAALERLGVADVGVIRAGDRRARPEALVQVASVQTLAARRVRLSPPPDVVVIDECHRAAAQSYQRWLYEPYPDAVVLGLTATPCRVDGRPLRGSFDDLVEVARYSDLIAGGFIAAPQVYSTPVLPDLAGVKSAGGDYNAAELEEAVNRGALVGNIGVEWQRRSEGRRTVVFCVSVAHSLAVRDMFLGLGVRAEHLDGATPEAEREAILARLASGETPVVCNVGVLTEGWDCPPVKCLVIARPTKSLSLWMQMAGRILRPWGDVTPIILDHGGNVDRHGLPHQDRAWSLSERAKKPPAEAQRLCKACFAYVAGSPAVCPHCGTPFVVVPPERAAKEPVPVDLELRELGGDPTLLGYFREEHRRARERGWKPGFVMHRFRERFGADAPDAWWTALKRDARRDREWKARIAARRDDAA